MTDDWKSYRRLVLSELARLDTKKDKIEAKHQKSLESIMKNKTNISSLTIKASLLGAIGGGFPTLTLYILSTLNL